jgi:hypothetical protein
MARSILSQLVSKPGKGSGGDEKRKRRERAAQRAAEKGPAGLAEKLNPLKADEWTLERQARREEVKEQYFREKRKLHVDERHARQRLKAQLERKRKEINDHYRVNHLKADDPRLEGARRMARRSFEKYERKVERQHNEQWKKTYRKLRNKRDRQYGDVTKEMKREFRKKRGLPDEMQAPWKF